MNEYIDIYCERLMPGFWAEPVNALTNISFLIAAFFAYRLTASLRGRRAEAIQKSSNKKLDCFAFARNDGQVYVLIFLLLAIGTGSFLFHTLANGWAQMADVLPILLYQLAFLVLYARGVMRQSWHGVLVLIGGFFAAIYLFALLPDSLLNGSLSYGPAFLFLSGLGIWHYCNATKEHCGLLLAAGIFLLSLAFRSADLAVCASFPLGTHFVWHVLNGAVLYLTARAYIQNISTRSP